MLESEKTVAEAITGANSPLRIIGGGTRALPGEGAVLRADALAGIRLYEPGALTLVAGAGTPVAQIEAALAAENQRLAFEPYFMGNPEASTIGGVVATNASGPRRVQAGACRDFLLGVRFVDGSGNIVKNGGRVMKNVTGYDLVKLMAGSRGTLGMLTEVSLKVLPRVEDAATLVVRGAAGRKAVAAMAAALGSPYEVSGAAHDPAAETTWLRVEGFGESVAYRVGRLKDVLMPFGAVDESLDRTATEALWADIRDAGPLREAAALWRVSIKPSDAPEFLSLIGRSDAVQSLMDWGGGLIWIGATEEQLAGAAESASWQDGMRALHHDLQYHAGFLGGHATLVRSPGKQVPEGLPVVQPEPPAIAALTRGLKAKFDPRGILNPGIMF